MDAYETLWRARAQEHGITDVGWYIHNGTDYERYADLAEAERKALEHWGQPSCGRGANCANIAPFLGGTNATGYFSSVHALLYDEYDDDEED